MGYQLAGHTPRMKEVFDTMWVRREQERRKAAMPKLKRGPVPKSYRAAMPAYDLESPAHAAAAAAAFQVYLHLAPALWPQVSSLYACQCKFVPAHYFTQSFADE